MGEFEILGTRLKLLRKRLKVNQTEFSKMIGISSATLSAYETGVKNPSLAVLKNIAETCNVSIDWLCGLSDKESFSDNIKTYSDIIKIIVGGILISFLIGYLFQKKRRREHREQNS